MNSIPICGFGTYCLKNDIGYNCTLYALNNGYNHIDTANLYQNETVIGKAILDSGIDRNKVILNLISKYKLNPSNTRIIKRHIKYIFKGTHHV